MQKLSIEQLSKWLEKVQRAQADFFPQTEMLIGGGSARDILDHLLFDQPLVTRDIDLFLVNGGRVAPARAKEFFDLLEQDGLGHLKTAQLRDKKRCNPALPKAERYNYVFGYGAHYFRPEHPILSLSVIHTNYDLELNGLLNIDKIYLRIRPGQSLKAYAEKLHKAQVSHRDLVAAGFIRDDFDGYAAWVGSRPELLNWAEVERSPLRMAIRITRSFAKAGCPDLPVEVKSRFLEMVASSPYIDDENEFRRGFVKIFSDRYWTNELTTLAGMGVLHHISQELEQAALGLNYRTLEKTHGDWKQRWNLMMDKLSPTERQRLNFQMRPAMATSFA